MSPTGTLQQRMGPWELLGHHCAIVRPRISRLIFKDLAEVKRFTSSTSHMTLPDSGGSFSSVEERGGEEYDHGIAFQRVAGLGILQRAEKQRTQRQKQNK